MNNENENQEPELPAAPEVAGVNTDVLLPEANPDAPAPVGGGDDATPEGVAAAKKRKSRKAAVVPAEEAKFPLDVAPAKDERGDMTPDFIDWLIETDPAKARAQYADRMDRLTPEQVEALNGEVANA